MSSNANLRRAKKVKNDEFYTQYSDVEAELSHYTKEFKGKWVYCWCDDPQHSQFWAYFRRNFRTLGLKRLTSTYYLPKGQVLRTDVLSNGRVIEKPLEGNGDFRSTECQDILRECDIVVTNPPFSLIKEMIPNIMAEGKKMVILGPVTAVTTNGIYEHFLAGKLWLGHEHDNNMAFTVPNRMKRADVYIGEDGKKKCDIGNIVWYTNLGRPIRHEGFDSTAEYKPKLHKVCDGTSIVNVDRLSDIPSDYYGPVAVPITGAPKLDPKQYEVLKDGAEEMRNKPVVDGQAKFKRIVVRKIPEALAKKAPTSRMNTYKHKPVPESEGKTSVRKPVKNTILRRKK